MVRVFWWSKKNFQFIFVNKKIKISLEPREYPNHKKMKIFFDPVCILTMKNFENFPWVRGNPNYEPGVLFYRLGILECGRELISKYLIDSRT